MSLLNEPPVTELADTEREAAKRVSPKILVLMGVSG
jgi:hypothetical protein